MSALFSWLKEIKQIKQSNRSLNDIKKSLEVHSLKGFEVELLGRAINKINNLESFECLKIAILSDNSTQPISNAIKVATIKESYSPIIYESPFGAIKQEILNTDSYLYTFKPDIVFIDFGYRSLENLPVGPITNDDLKDKINLEIKSFKILWSFLKTNLNKPIIQNTIVSPPLIFRDLSEYKINWSPIKFIEELNYKLISFAPSEVNWLDLDKLSKIVGIVNWQDQRLFHHARYGFSIDFLPDYLNWVQSCIRSIISKTYKCLVVDLDNTLWGGIIGDDGIDGIKLGPNTAEGSCFEEFCNYLLSLKKRGVILGICSKNELKNVKEVFNNHPNMPLGLDDFSSIKCNWLNKSQNLKEIADELNIDLASIVFVDDNPAECELIRQKIPSIYTINLDEDPSQNIFKLDHLNLFRQENLTNEDLNRQNSYIARKKFEENRVNYKDINEYLISLKMKCHFEKVQEKHLNRIEQMQQKTNQFNLSTKRYKKDEIREKLSNSESNLYIIKLKDKFSDHGLISYVELRHNKDSVEILDWLISCRVFSRTLEEFILKNIANKIKNSEINKIKILYKQSPKNTLIREKLEELKFIIEKKDEIEIWTNSISKIKRLSTFINNTRRIERF